uniref:(northern house mosquito) hypothetical protein n=1 Tax=Culex pipiens TaxID=7175 RepID=A0A8D8B6J1_CULPI
MRLFRRRHDVDRDRHRRGQRVLVEHDDGRGIDEGRSGGRRPKGQLRRWLNRRVGHQQRTGRVQRQRSAAGEQNRRVALHDDLLLRGLRLLGQSGPDELFKLVRIHRAASRTLALFATRAGKEVVKRQTRNFGTHFRGSSILCSLQLFGTRTKNGTEDGRHQLGDDDCVWTGTINGIR